MTEMAKGFLRENLDVEKKLTPLIQLLESEGFEAFYSVEITGVSGSTHMFDLTAERDGATILFDFGLAIPTSWSRCWGRRWICLAARPC